VNSGCRAFRFTPSFRAAPPCSEAEIRGLEPPWGAQDMGLLVKMMYAYTEMIHWQRKERWSVEPSLWTSILYVAQRRRWD
jgi:hypothetical protein